MRSKIQHQVKKQRDYKVGQSNPLGQENASLIMRLAGSYDGLASQDESPI